ncbi:hypothetical protein [Nonomuraea sp. NPDC049400]|uniref:hypothetical protein n=1 Tax=Nonomuraea sp. NPDC049400 TaxID=3364352 RepID=UPI0037ABEAFB
MKALIVCACGSVEQLRIHDMPDPSPGPGQVITGELRAMSPVTHPFVPGVEATGVVAAVGKGVTWRGKIVIAF